MDQGTASLLTEQPNTFWLYNLIIFDLQLSLDLIRYIIGMHGKSGDNDHILGGNVDAR